MRHYDFGDQRPAAGTKVRYFGLKAKVLDYEDWEPFIERASWLVPILVTGERNPMYLVAFVHVWNLVPR